MKKLLIFLPLVLYFLIVYRPFIFHGKMPIPADTIVGLYHPWRDYFANQYPNGVPFKNSLITDAVRQEYPWRELAISQLKQGKLPLWNPYSFGGYPLLANMQSAPFYPLNLLYWLVSFPVGWSLQVMLQTILGGIFMALFLRNLKLRDEAVALGAVVWTGSGFVVGWLMTNVVVQSAIWLPLLLLATDMILEKRRPRFWGAVLVFSLVSTFLAGHLQVAFYSLVVWFFYAVVRWRQTGNGKNFIYILGLGMVSIVITLPFWITITQFILLSARSIDQSIWHKNDWFLPWQNLIQFVAPDFFGNPATLNYFGVFNYAEFVGYIGLLPLILALLAIFSKHRDRWIFLGIGGGALILALPTIVAKVPFILNWPFISTAQPSRLLVVVDFSLAVLAAMGCNYLLESNNVRRRTMIILAGLGVIFSILWFIAWKQGLAVSIRNMYFPTLILILSGGLLLFWQERWRKVLTAGLFLVVLIDLTRFAVKFLPFSPQEWLFPETKVTRFLEDRAKSDVFRIAPLDPRVMAQNFSTVYRIQSITGYDPLYLLSYGEFVVAMERGLANFKPPFYFDRIVGPQNINSPLFDLFGVKYVLTLNDLESPGYNKVFQEGETRVYENSKALPRAFFVSKVTTVSDGQQAMEDMFDPSFRPRDVAVVERFLESESIGMGVAVVSKYTSSEVVVSTRNNSRGFLVLTDIYYPSWRAEIDGKLTEIYVTDFTFRGVSVPEGRHTIRFFL